MDDFGWCPLKDCAAVAEIDRLKNYGQCTQCHFVFCLTCKEKYHFFKRCPSLQVQYDAYNGEFKDEEEKHIQRI